MTADDVVPLSKPLHILVLDSTMKHSSHAAITRSAKQNWVFCPAVSCGCRQPQSVQNTPHT